MSPYTKIGTVPTYSIETLSIVPSTPPNSPYITKSDIDNTVNYIHNDIISYFKATNNNITAFNDNITAMIESLIDANYKQNKQEEKITELSSKYQLMKTA